VRKEDDAEERREIDEEATEQETKNDEQGANNEGEEGRESGNGENFEQNFNVETEEVYWDEFLQTQSHHLETINDQERSPENSMAHEELQYSHEKMLVLENIEIDFKNDSDNQENNEESCYPPSSNQASLSSSGE